MKSNRKSVLFWCIAIVFTIVIFHSQLKAQVIFNTTFTSFNVIQKSTKTPIPAVSFTANVVNSKPTSTSSSSTASSSTAVSGNSALSLATSNAKLSTANTAAFVKPLALSNQFSSAIAKPAPAPIPKPTPTPAPAPAPPTPPTTGGVYSCGTTYSLNASMTIFELRFGTSATSPLIGTLKSTDFTATCNAKDLSAGYTITGNFSKFLNANTQEGIYTVFATIYIIDNIAGQSKVTTAQQSFTLGNQAEWIGLYDMGPSTTAEALVRTTVSANQVYSGARTKAELAANVPNGFAEFGAEIKSTEPTGSVYIALSTSVVTSSFDPLAPGASYVEYRKTSPTTAVVYIRDGVKGILSGPLPGFNKDSRIRVEKNNNAFTFYGVNSNVPIPNTPVIGGFNKDVNISAFATNKLDGVMKPVTSFKIIPKQANFAHLQYEMDGYYYTFANVLRFVYNQDYDASTLKFNIYSLSPAATKVKDQSNYPIQNVTYGENYISIDLNGEDYCIGGGFFYLEVISDKKEPMYMRFNNEVDWKSCKATYTNNGFVDGPSLGNDKVINPGGGFAKPDNEVKGPVKPFEKVE